MNKHYKLLLIGLIFLSSCSVGTGNWNDHIDAESRAQIKTLNDKMIDALHDNNPQKLREIFSDKLKEKSGADLDAFVSKVHESFESTKYSLLDEYLTNGSAVGTTAIVFKGVSGEYDYKINYEPQTKETYISLVINDGIAHKVLLTCIYGKYGDDWKLNVLKIGDYSYFGKNAVDFYKQAKTNYASGNLIDAADDIAMVQRTAAPAEQLFQYQKEDEMKEFATKVMTEANSKFPLPMKIADVKTNPQVYNISPKVMRDGIFPMVTYISKIDLKDTVALKKENEELKKVIGTIFPGIEKGKKFVFFQAYYEVPNGNTPTEHYGFVLRNE